VAPAAQPVGGTAPVAPAVLSVPVAPAACMGLINKGSSSASAGTSGGGCYVRRSSCCS